MSAVVPRYGPDEQADHGHHGHCLGYVDERLEAVWVYEHHGSEHDDIADEADELLGCDACVGCEGVLHSLEAGEYARKDDGEGETTPVGLDTEAAKYEQRETVETEAI